MNGSEAKKNRFNRLSFKLGFAAFILLVGTAIGILIKRPPVSHPQSGSATRAPRMEYITGQSTPDPNLGYLTKPYTWCRQYYPDNPRQYFHPISAAERILVGGGFAAAKDVEFRVIPDSSIFPLTLTVESNVPDASYSSASFRHAGVDIPANGNAKLIIQGSSEKPRRVDVHFSPAGDLTHPFSTTSIEFNTQAKEYALSFPSSTADAKVAVGLDFGPRASTFRVDQLMISGLPQPSDGQSEFSVDYIFNKWGHRDSDWTPECPQGVSRIAFLGDSFTFAQGVHRQDSFAEVVASLLNEQRTSNDPRFESLNFGMMGYSTKEELEVLKTQAIQFSPQIVVLTMCWNDSLSFEREAALHRSINRIDFPEKFEAAFMKIIETEGYKGCIDLIAEMNSFCKEHGCQLVVGILDINQSSVWERMVTEVLPAMKELNIPAFNIKDELLAAGCFGVGSFVHPMDLHPNEKAHAIYAKKLSDVIRNEVIAKRP